MFRASSRDVPRCSTPQIPTTTDVRSPQYSSNLPVLNCRWLSFLPSSRENSSRHLQDNDSDLPAWDTYLYNAATLHTSKEFQKLLLLLTDGDKRNCFPYAIPCLDLPTLKSTKISRASRNLSVELLCLLTNNKSSRSERKIATVSMSLVYEETMVCFKKILVFNFLKQKKNRGVIGDYKVSKRKRF